MKAVVIGRGRWGRRLAGMLEGEGHVARMLSLRPDTGESDRRFAGRVTRTLDAEAGNAALVWLAVPPAAPQAALVEGALAAGRHVVVEKPWWVDTARTADLMDQAARRGLIAAVHFQYCYLDAWPSLARDFNAGGAEFHGVFTTARPARADIPAADNLATHLLAVRRHWFPRAELTGLHAAYESRDRRIVDLSRGGRTERVDFTSTKQPIVQRFLADLSRRAAAGGGFPLDLAFAADVQADLAAFAGRGPLPSGREAPE